MLNPFSVGLFATPWTITHQVPLSVGFSRQEYCSGLACPPHPEDPPDSGIKPVSAIACIWGGGGVGGWVWVGVYAHVLSCPVMSDSLQPHGL